MEGCTSGHCAHEALETAGVDAVRLDGCVSPDDDALVNDPGLTSPEAEVLLPLEYCDEDEPLDRDPGPTPPEADEEDDWRP